MVLMGIDLAWNANRNSSALAVGDIHKTQYKWHLVVDNIEPSITGIEQILLYIQRIPNLQGIAIDAPLIINNDRGQRQCEHSLAKDYAGKYAACHPTNKTLYPNAQSVELSRSLAELGFNHVDGPQWQIECYPHPAIIECFGLAKRLGYKKGSVEQKRQGQIEFSCYLHQLRTSPILALDLPQKWQYHCQPSYISELKGKALKTNEDVLDAIFCLYIAGLYQRQVSGRLYGDTTDGYIWVPQTLVV